MEFLKLKYPVRFYYRFFCALICSFKIFIFQKLNLENSIDRHFFEKDLAVQLINKSVVIQLLSQRKIANLLAKFAPWNPNSINVSIVNKKQLASNGITVSSHFNKSLNKCYIRYNEFLIYGDYWGDHKVVNLDAFVPLRREISKQL